MTVDNQAACLHVALTRMGIGHRKGLKVSQCPKGGKNWAQEGYEGAPVPKTKKNWTQEGYEGASVPKTKRIGHRRDMKAPQCPKGGKDWAQEGYEGAPVPKGWKGLGTGEA